jgi:hypothetical protein
VGVIGVMVVAFLISQGGLTPVVGLTPPVVIAILLIMIGWWLDSRMIRAGKAFLLIAGLISVLLAARLISDINGYAVGTVMLAIEAALVASGARRTDDREWR